MKVHYFPLSVALLYMMTACNSATNNTQQASTSNDTATSVETNTEPEPYKLSDKTGLFMQVKAKKGMMEQLLLIMRQSVGALNKATNGPDVFIVHTFPGEPDMAYVYLLGDKAGGDKGVDPLVSELKQKASAYIASITTYPLNPQFGRLPK